MIFKFRLEYTVKTFITKKLLAKRTYQKRLSMVLRISTSEVLRSYLYIYPTNHPDDDDLRLARNTPSPE